MEVSARDVAFAVDDDFCPGVATYGGECATLSM